MVPFPNWKKILGEEGVSEAIWSVKRRRWRAGVVEDELGPRSEHGSDQTPFVSSITEPGMRAWMAEAVALETRV